MIKIINISKEKEKAIREHSRGFKNAYRKIEKKISKELGKNFFY
jgi:hypothetical protein